MFDSSTSFVSVSQEGLQRSAAQTGLVAPDLESTIHNPHRVHARSVREVYHAEVREVYHAKLREVYHAKVREVYHGRSTTQS